MIKAVLFDLDGTLLPMSEKTFTEGYFKMLCKKLAPLGYEPETLVKTIWTGTKAMVNNDGKKTNEQVFWETFASIYGTEKLKDRAVFEDFYANDFNGSKIFCGENPQAKEIIEYVKDKGIKIVLATNPLFPNFAMMVRAGFLGLNEDDFDYVSGYENSHYAKPNPKYYLEVLETNGLKADEVVYFANNKTEDYDPATSVGIKTLLIKGEGLTLEEVKTVLD